MLTVYYQLHYGPAQLLLGGFLLLSTMAFWLYCKGFNPAARTLTRWADSEVQLNYLELSNPINPAGCKVLHINFIPLNQYIICSWVVRHCKGRCTHFCCSKLTALFYETTLALYTKSLAPFRAGVGPGLHLQECLIKNMQLSIYIKTWMSTLCTHVITHTIYWH